MSLYDAVKELDADLEKDEKEINDAENNEKKDDVKEEDATSTAEEESGDDDNDKDKEDDADKSKEKKIEDAADDEEEEEDEKPADTAALSRMRRQASAEKRRADALQAQIDLQNAQNAQPKEPELKKAASSDDEPDVNEDPDAHLRWELRQSNAKLKEVSDWKEQQTQQAEQTQIRNNAVQSFTGYEDNFKTSAPDYNEVTAFGVQQIAASISKLRPDLRGADLGKVVQDQVLRMAGQALDAGHDPAEYFYQTSKNWGYRPAEKKADSDDNKEEKLKPTLKNISKHKKRSVSSQAAGGVNGSSPLSAESFRDMKFHEVARLSPKDLKQWELEQA